MREREWCYDVCTLKQFWVVANLPELHHQVHERASGISITEIRRLCEQIGDRDVGGEDFVQLPLSGAQINVNVNFDLEFGEPLEVRKGRR